MSNGVDPGSSPTGQQPLDDLAFATFRQAVKVGDDCARDFARQIFSNQGFLGLREVVRARSRTPAESVSQQMVVELLCDLAANGPDDSAKYQAIETLKNVIQAENGKHVIFSFGACLDPAVPELRAHLLSLCLPGTAIHRSTLIFALARMNRSLTLEFAAEMVETMRTSARMSSVRSWHLQPLIAGLTGAKGRGFLSELDIQFVESISNDPRFKDVLPWRLVLS
ncbi:MAG: hypothetical protein K1X83_02385 [Oligoflexia bacterium]|nr:hypothetical protein [Oligoflexia bacterium]